MENSAKPFTVLGVPLQNFIQQAQLAGEDAIRNRFYKGLYISGLDHQGRLVRVYPDGRRDICETSAKDEQ